MKMKELKYLTLLGSCNVSTSVNKATVLTSGENAIVSNSLLTSSELKYCLKSTCPVSENKFNLNITSVCDMEIKIYCLSQVHKKINNMRGRYVCSKEQVKL